MNIVPSSGVRDCRRGGAMARYFFDVRDDDRVIPDAEGLEFSDLGAVRAEAATALAEMARDVLATATRRRMSIDVRTGATSPSSGSHPLSSWSSSRDRG